MKKYIVVIKETSEYREEVKAKDKDEAEDIVLNLYGENEIMPNWSDVDITECEESSIQECLVCNCEIIKDGDFHFECEDCSIYVCGDCGIELDTMCSKCGNEMEDFNEDGD